MKKEDIDLLLKMGNELHPHLGDDNHTNRLIRQALDDKRKLTQRDCFDLGKYTARMKIHLSGTDETWARASAISQFKGIF